MRFEELARASAEVAGTRSRLSKVRRLAAALRDMSPREVAVAVVHLAGELPGGTIGIGWAALRDPPAPADGPSLEVLDVHATLERIRETTGPGSQRARRELLAGLLSRATAEEQRFLRGLLLGELRQGALEGVMVDAVAAAADVAPPEVRRALMLAGDLGAVAAAAMGEGSAGLARFRLQVLRPLQPM
ncbi:MAG: ATP-dependent DNA ligase, partial [Actinobacteria bacterium]|nr:ATP-dependent DNA ligase [Actinomycetota bacterium]